MRELSGAQALVVGGAGFVGSNLVRHLLESGAASVHIVDNLLSSERALVPDVPEVRFTQGSIASDRVLWELEEGYDYVFHLATFHGNQSSIHDPLRDHENNLVTTLKLFERLKSFRGLRRVVYAAAGCSVAEKTFDDAEATTEDAPISLRMDSPYSISKLVGELYAVYYHERHELPTVRARFQNVYGPGEVLGAGEWRGTPATVWRNVTPTFIWKALEGLPLPLENEGIATRDFIFVDDICRGLLACAVRGEAGDVYNLATGEETSIRALAETVNELCGGRSEIELRPKRDWDNSGKRYASTEKAERVLGFRAEVGMREGLERTVRWTKENQSFIRQCLAKHDAQVRAFDRA